MRGAGETGHPTITLSRGQLSYLLDRHKRCKAPSSLQGRNGSNIDSPYHCITQDNGIAPHPSNSELRCNRDVRCINVA